MIICGRLHKKLSNIAEAGFYFYRAAQVGQSILKIYSTITFSCTTAFLEVTESVVSTTRTETVTRKEELLRYMISACKVQHGKTSDTVIRYSKILAELYVSIHEEQKAEECWKVLHEIMIARYGKGSAEETSISGHLKIILKKGEKHEEIIEYERRIFDDSITVLDLWSERHIKTIRELAGACEKRGELLKTEEYYVTLWRGLIEHYHQIRTHSVDTDVHLSMIDISLEYVHFLRRHHRHEEAAGVLICIWAEYEEYTFESEIIFLRLKKIGELMRATSLLSIAISVFKKCWAWFKSHGKLEISASCQILISETIEQIITTTQTTTVSTSTTTTTSTEIIVREVFESSISKSTVTIETISICQSLISLYMKNENWAEAIHASKRSLELIWKMIVSGRGTIALCREFSSEAIDIAIRLAICHQRSHHFHEAEAIYIRIYRACFNSCQVNDERLTKAYSILVKFYEEHEHWHKVVAIHQELLVAYRKHLGKKHNLTIKTLYTLGSLCSVHGHGHSHEYYEEIITVINADSKVCHREALVAMEIMCRVYFEEGHWQKLKQVCEVLWETWVHHHHDHKLEAHFIELLYMRYIYVLEHHSNSGYEVIRTITIQYRETCLKAFGVSVAITIRALVELARICMKHEKYMSEAITHYEEVSSSCDHGYKGMTADFSFRSFRSSRPQRFQPKPRLPSSQQPPSQLSSSS
jgi:tetratricopeptide (TPR) repeat protein